MRKVVKPKFKDYFSLEKTFQGKDALLHYEVQNFNKLTSLILLTSVISMVSIFETNLLIFPLTIIIFLLLNYIFLYIKVKNLYITRKVQKNAKENEIITVMYIITNNSPFKLKEYYLQESFTGSSDSKKTKYISQSIQRNSKSVIKQSLALNEGFGEHYFNEINLEITDALALFKFKITNNQKQKLLVYPSIQDFNPEIQTNNDDTFLTGDFEIFTKGVSPNFYGIRQYNFGDSLKYINWKLSRKLNELVVNEYENAVNLKVNYVLNFDERAHFGIGVNSTWEYCRDICLSLIKKNIEKNHSVEVFSNEFHVEKGNGKQFFEFLELKMCYLKPKGEAASELLSKNIHLLEKGSALVLITPLNQGQGIASNIKFLKGHIDHFSSVQIYVIDAFDVNKKNMPSELKGDLFKSQKYANDFLKDEILTLRTLGVKVFHTEVKAPHKIKNQTKRLFGDLNVSN
jgi:uncharacterized protein (DUF58 family)